MDCIELACRDIDEGGDELLDASIVGGTLVSLAPAEGSTWNVRIAGPSEAWDMALAPLPAPGATSIVRIPGMRVEGDVVADKGPYGPAISRLVRLLSELEHGPAPMEWVEEYPFKATDNAMGRYVYVSVDAVEYRIYYEQAGKGTPLLLLHTAGADSRQWRHLLADPVMQRDYSMTAFDLPYHGRSLPPTHGVRWWEQDYSVTKEELHHRIVGLSRTLSLDRPISMGTSMGGQLAPELIGHFPDDFRAAVAVNGWYHMESFAGFSNEHFHHPRIHPDHYAGSMYEGTAPIAPEPFRRENSWIYASGGPAVYKGDNEYFIAGHDLRIDGHLVDTAKMPLAVVVGEYDSASMMPNGSEAIVDSVPGSRYHVLEGLSHFAMADDPFASTRRSSPCSTGSPRRRAASPMTHDDPGSLHTPLRQMRGTLFILAIRAFGLAPTTAHFTVRPHYVHEFGWSEDDPPEVGPALHEATAAAESLTASGWGGPETAWTVTKHGRLG